MTDYQRTIGLLSDMGLEIECNPVYFIDVILEYEIILRKQEKSLQGMVFRFNPDQKFDYICYL